MLALKDIRLENNSFTGTLHGPSLARTVSRLEILSLSDNNISGLTLEELGAPSDLRYLYLDSNHLVGSPPGQLAKATPLRELWLQENALSGTVPASFACLENLHHFFIDRNKLTGALPPDLCHPRINADFLDDDHFADTIQVGKIGIIDRCISIVCPTRSVAPVDMHPCTSCPGGEASRL